MYRLQLLVVALLFSASALGQSGAAANVNASASQNTSVSANKSGAQAQSNTSANADASAQASHRDHESASKPQSRRDSAGSSGAGQLASGTMINAALVKPVDARKDKPGDTVMAKTTQDVRSGGQVVIAKGSGIVGHVTQTNTRAAGSSESNLGIVFDHAILKNGQEVPINTSIQAIAAAQTAATASATDDMGSMPASGMGSSNVSNGTRTSGGLLGGVGATAGAAGGAVTNTTTNLGRTTGGTMNAAASAGGSLNSTSSGIVGLGGMTLNSATSAGAQGSVITSAGKNIHLDSGTQMLLKVTSSATQK